MTEREPRPQAHDEVAPNPPDWPPTGEVVDLHSKDWLRERNDTLTDLQQVDEDGEYHGHPMPTGV